MLDGGRFRPDADIIITFNFCFAPIILVALAGVRIESRLYLRECERLIQSVQRSGGRHEKRANQDGVQENVYEASDSWGWVV